MDKKIIELDLTRLNDYQDQYQDNVARQPKPKIEPIPEIKPAPKKGVRTHSAPRHKSEVRVGWLAAFMVVAALYMVLVSQHMRLTELSLEASQYEATILESDEEISKMKKFTLNQITSEQIDAFVRANDMDVLERSGVEYLNAAREEVIVSYTADAEDSEAGKALALLGEKLEGFIEFFR